MASIPRTFPATPRNYGSDEPGTSACNNGLFFCLNKHHVPQYIPASKVNDGICDPECCDGSDEYLGSVKCPNKCKELGDETRQLEEKLLKIRKTALKIKKTYVDHAKSAASSRKSQIDNLASESVSLESQLESATHQLSIAESQTPPPIHDRLAKCADRVNSLKSRAKYLRDKFTQYESALEIVRILNGVPPSAPLRDEPTMVGVFEKVQLFVDTYGIADPYMGEPIESEDDEFYLDNESDKLSVADDGNLEACESSDSKLTECLSRTAQVSLNSFKSGVSNIVGWPGYKKILPFLKSGGGETGSGSDEGSAGDLVSVERARAKVSAIESRKREVDDKLKDLRTRDGMDFGPNGVWEMLYQKCFNYVIGEYKYEVCMLDKAAQKSVDNDYGPSLGTFSKWGDRDNTLEGPEKYKTMVYEFGEQCWNGPQRSLQVSLECGTENQIFSVSEPSKCVYNMKMKSPAVCDGDIEEPQKVQDEL
ncbi:hypothetical protein HK098_000273 [Nowakowskiella sp. JEL0407]|nr:hypothetical protein HK098_000273 [Nowakowskiella sp. JEL0407]